MFDKILEIKDRIVDKVKHINIVQGLEICSGVSLILGGLFINFLSGDELIADTILDDDDRVIEIDDAVIEDEE